MPELPGSPKYLRKAYQKLRALVREFGNPTLFITLTTNSKDDALLEFLRNMNPGKTIHSPKDDQYMTSIFYHFKYQKIIRSITGHAKNKFRGLFGTVTSHFCRLEY